MSVLIRKADPAEASALSALARRAKASWGYPEEWLAAWREDLEITPDYLALHQVLVAETDRILSGVVAVEVTGDTAGLEHMWVEPSRQGQGVGRALVRRAMDVASSAGCVALDVVSDPNAKAFYERLGGRPTGELPAPMPGAPERTLPVLRFTLPAGEAEARGC